MPTLNFLFRYLINIKSIWGRNAHIKLYLNLSLKDMVIYKFPKKRVNSPQLNIVPTI